ncbi:putative BOI-related E3 ubiquitin-protein ligase 3 [Senna tora]|uniref:Putative BOI-related E3 ubiquitin-protein ligase 3 n=1 Tax=Senna tora TaxID=362788 RepID=A0A834T0F2_9FABA|nr:putative BOI-related E3 ubiquitin-protein ligase 3 [Senna tora]
MTSSLDKIFEGIQELIELTDLLIRKRSRDSTNYPILSYPAATTHTDKNCGYFTFLGEDITDEIHQQQHNIDRLRRRRWGWK